MENMIHKMLECRVGVAEAKRHYDIFKVTKTGTECRLQFIALSDPCQVVDPAQIWLGKNSRQSEQFQYQG